MVLLLLLVLRYLWQINWSRIGAVSTRLGVRSVTNFFDW